MNKTAILPVLSVIALAIATLTGHKISPNFLDQLATAISIAIPAGVSIWGIFHNHKKDGEKQ